jgi:isopropylmalate/homocitrate/citramalate synthase
MRDDLILEDTTLRDGEQSPGIAFSKATKLNILQALKVIGLKWVEVGIPAMGGDEADTMKEMLDLDLDLNLVAWNRGVKGDIQNSIELGFKFIHIGLPTSKIHLDSSVRKSREWLLTTAADLIAYCKDMGAFVSISAEDIGRTEPSFLQEYAHCVWEAGADRLRLSDTIGIMSPAKYSSAVKNVMSACEIDLQCHTHNDFGLAVANTLAGLEAGARYFHVTVNGIGERAGMPDIAQVVMALKVLHGVDLGIQLDKLGWISGIVEAATKYSTPPHQPVVGSNIFAHESGIHASAMIGNPSTFEPFMPEVVGAVRRYVIGKHSGRAIIEYKLRELGIVVNNKLLPSCLILVRAQAIKQQGPLDAKQLIDVYESVSREDS